MLQIPYDSKEGYEFMSKLAETLSYFSMDESVVISKSRGAFPLFDKTGYKNGDIPLSGYHEIPKDSHYYDWDSLIEKIKNYRNQKFMDYYYRTYWYFVNDCRCI